MGKVRILILVMIVCGLATYASAGELRLHELKAFWVKYLQKGTMMKGEVISQCRNWCNEQVETRKIKISMGAMTQNQNTRVLTIKDKIYTTDLDTGRATVAANPMYESVAKTVKEKGVKDLNKSLLSAWGFKPTDTVRTIAGETCRDYVSEQMMGVKNCFTDDGIALRTEGPGMVQEAVEIKRNDPGDIAAYQIPKNPVQPAAQGQPGMQQLEEFMKQIQKPSAE